MDGTWPIHVVLVSHQTFLIKRRRNWLAVKRGKEKQESKKSQKRYESAGGCEAKVNEHT